MKTLLILGCSQRKRPDPDGLMALDRYDGPLVRVVRRWQRDLPTDAARRRLDVYFISAKFGLLSSREWIRPYDQQMTLARADELRPAIEASVRGLLTSGTYTRVGICLGRVYMRALGDVLMVGEGLPAISLLAIGGIGRQAQHLKAWLGYVEVAS